MLLLLNGTQSAAKTTKEVHYIDLNSVQGAAQHALLKLSLLQERVTDMRYSAEHHGDHFYIVTNADGARERLVVTTVTVSTTNAVAYLL
jgi:oligopeptidase B